MKSRLVFGIVLVFVVFFVVTQPNKSADIVHNAWQVGVNVAHGMADFVDQI